METWAMTSVAARSTREIGVSHANTYLVACHFFLSLHLVLESASCISRMHGSCMAVIAAHSSRMHALDVCMASLRRALPGASLQKLERTSKG